MMFSFSESEIEMTPHPSSCLSLRCRSRSSLRKIAEDDNVAIEIEFQGESKATENAPPAVVHDQNTESTVYMDPSLQGLAKEDPTVQVQAKPFTASKEFLRRLFKKHRKTNPDTAGPNPLPLQNTSLADLTDYPIPPSSIHHSRVSPPKVRVGVISRNCEELAVEDKIDDSFSRMSDLTTPTVTRQSYYQPIPLNRHNESLGHQSIRDIRAALKEMESQLVSATTTGQRVSRRKVMGALLTVADSLEDIDEREFLRKELEDLMQEERRERYHQIDGVPLRIAPSLDERSASIWTDDYDEDYTIEDEENFRYDDETYTQNSNDRDKESPSFSLFSPVGKLFGANEKEEANNVLNDLQWTEFVASRRPRPNKNERKSKVMQRTKRSRNSNSESFRHSRDRRLSASSIENIPHQYSRESYGRIQHYDATQRGCHSLDHDNLGDKRNRSWWRRHPVTTNQADDRSLESFEGEHASHLPKNVTFHKSNRRTLIRI